MHNMSKLMEESSNVAMIHQTFLIFSSFFEINNHGANW